MTAADCFRLAEYIAFRAVMVAGAIAVVWFA